MQSSISTVDFASDRYLIAAVPMTQVLFGFSKGIAPPELCETAGVSPLQLVDRDRLVPHTWHLALWDALRTHLPDVPVGIEMGQFMTPDHFGYAGLVFRHARDGLDAMYKLARFARLLDSHAPRYAGRFEVNAREVTVTAPPEVMNGRLECTECTMISLLTQLEALTGTRPEVREVHMHLDGRHHAAHYERIFGCPVRFGCKEDGLVLGRDSLSVPLKDANPQASARIDAYVEATCASHRDESFAAELAWIVRAQLEDGEVSQRVAAQALGLGARSLQRRLSKQNLTFGQVVEQVRRDTAERMLRETHAAVYEIAFCLGYQDVSSFSRAFKRWHGVSPASFRQDSGVQ